ncbi:MAG: PAS domain-containing protein [Planctomycetia bacterium]|nr:PAS domain-containing protein [Planctomycetia bacterium]
MKKPKKAPNKAQPGIPGRVRTEASGPAAAQFPIAGIGASAGGLEAVTALLKSLPDDTGIAFVFVQHLAPRHTSALSAILAKSTKMPVFEAHHDAVVKPNTIYVIPPGVDLGMAQGKLQVIPSAESRMPPRIIDRFLQALAEDAQAGSVGVILSGTGTDGTLGLKAIKEAGGITFAQDGTAAHRGMPESAVAGDCVDFVLPPAKIADELVRLSRHRRFPHPADAPEPRSPVQVGHEDAFTSILQLLTGASGIHFAQYKEPTLRRRIERRMVLRRLDTLESYLDCLRTEPGELEALYHEILIQVTSFFRDPETFEALQKSVFPRLIDGRAADAPVRIWVTGCATGEEVYSLAIALLECLDDKAVAPPIKIFATDVSEPAISKARAGVYQESATADISAERLRKYFVKTDAGYQIAKNVRDLCIFARQDLTRDPPFSQLDLVSCRNVLIYLWTELQSRVIPIFHYALHPGGFLILGTAESIGPFSNLFDAFDKKHRFYRRTRVASRLTFDYSLHSNLSSGLAAPEERGATAFPAGEIQREADRVVLAKYAPPGVVVDERLQIIQFRGHTGAFLEPAPGSPSCDLLQMAREGLLPELSAALESAKSTGLPERRTGVRVKTNGRLARISLDVIPLTLPSSTSRCYIVLFEEGDPRPESAAPAVVPQKSARRGRPETDARETAVEVDRLTHELSATKAYLQSVIEAKEAGNEELKAANEEIVSSNEELQSTNEELETAKEELQATNEELATVNDELQNRIRTATQLNDDLINLVDSVNIPILMLSHDLRLRRFSPSAQKLFHLRPGDVGRRLSDFKPRVSVPDLVPFVNGVLDNLTPVEREVTDDEGRWLTMQIRPYRTADNKIDGVIISLYDIDALKRKEHQLVLARDFADKIIESLRGPLLVLDETLRVRFANRAFYDLFHTSPEATETMQIYALGGGHWNTPRLRTLLEEVIATDKLVRDFRVEAEFANIGRKSMLVNARRIAPAAGERESASILISIEDLTEREQAQQLEREVAEIAAYEQRRIGQDLHDSTGQVLSGLSYLARSLAEERQTKSPADAKNAALITAELERALGQVRRISRGLVPVEVDSQGLMAALESLVERTGKMSDVKCTFHCETPVLIDDNQTATQLFLIAQEAVTNAVKHARAQNIHIELHVDGQRLTLEVRDDGTGIANVPPTTGMGLRIMNYRAGLIGCKLTVQKMAEGGTRVTCVIPWNKNHDRQNDSAQNPES